MATNASAGFGTVDMRFTAGMDVSQVLAASDAMIAKNQQLAMSLAKLGLVRDSLMRGFKSIGMAALIGGGAIAAMGIGTGMLITEAKDFDGAMRRVAALGGTEFAQSMDTIIKKTTEMGARWGVSSVDIANGMIELVKTGFDYAEVMEMIESITQTAVTNQMNFADMAGVAASATLLFRNSGYSTAQMLEILHSGAAMARLDMEDMDRILGYVGSSAVIAGLSIEELTAFMGALSNAAFQSHQSVRTMIAHIVAEADEIEAYLGMVGVELKVVAEDGTLALGDIVNAMAEGKLTLMDWAEIWKIIGIRSGQALTVGAVMSESYFEILNKLSPTTDNLVDAATVMSTSLPAMWSRLIETFHQAIYTEDYMNSLRDIMLSLVDAVKELGPSLQELLTIMITGFKDNLPMIVDLLKMMIETGHEFLPTLMAYVRVFGWLFEALKMLGPVGLNVIIHFMLLNKVFGLTTVTMQAFTLKSNMMISSLKLQGLNLKATAGGLNAQATAHNTAKIAAVNHTMALDRMRMTALTLQVALGGVFTLMMAMTAQSEEERWAFIALAAVTWALVGVHIALAVAKTAAETTIFSPIAIPIILAAVGAGVAYAVSIPASQGYELGTPYVPSTGMYMLHRGEAVVPASDNRQYSGIHGGEFNFNFYDSGVDDFEYVMARYGK